MSRKEKLSFPREKRNLSKIIKAERLSNLDFLLPKPDLSEEDNFCPLLSPPEEDSLQDPSAEEQFNQSREEGFRKGFEQGFKEGKEEGFKTGLAEGLKEAEKKIQEEVERLHKKHEEERAKERERFFELVERIEKEFEGTILGLDREILKLALGMAQKLVFKTIKEDPELLLRIIREALKFMAEGSEIWVKINPEDLEFLRGRISELPKGYKINFVPEEDISRGGVFIESKMGVIDATFEKRWQKLLEAIEYEDKTHRENSPQT